MKKGIAILILLLCALKPGFGQQGVSWLRCLGGTAADNYYQSVITRQGSIISIGNSESTNGDATGNHGTVDVILSALSPNGTVQWHKMIGGSDWDGVNAVDIDTLTDGNFVIAFSSASTNGDIAGNHGVTDFVIRKYTPAGTLVWSKTLGGNKEEDLDAIRATADGGLIVVGGTWSSNNGDVGPNHGTNTFDLWVVKLDASGNIQWQKTLGGSADDHNGSVFPAADGGYYFSCTTKSADGDLAGLLPDGTATGVSDIWFGKLSNTGSLLWSKKIGGSSTEDFSFVYAKNEFVYLAFGTASADRDIPMSYGGYDAMLAKYTATGTLVWKQVYGGLSFDSPSAFAIHPDGTAYLLMNVWSFTSFCGLPFSSPGENQFMLVKIDPLTGTMGLFRSYGGSQRDYSCDLNISAAGEFIMTGFSHSNDNGITGNHGNADGLILKAARGNVIQGYVYSDRNNNNVYDPAVDQRLSYIPVETKKQNLVQDVSVSNEGIYTLETDTGTYMTKPRIYHSSYYTAFPDSFTCTFNSAPQSFYKDIRLQAVPGIRDLAVFTTPVGATRPAFQITYLLLGQNLGTDTVPAGTISWKKDPRVTVSNYSVAPTAVFGDSVVWNFTNLRPLDSIRIFIRVNTPPPPQLNANDTLKYVARIFPTAADADLSDNTLYLFNMVRGPYDPNEKINLAGNKMTVGEVQAGNYLNYVIHFQNVGNAEAFDVIIHDTLSARLQLSTLQSLASSHPFTASISGNIVKWKFLNIHLPDSTSNEPGSHGFIAFRVKPAPGLLAGDSVVNRAGIYFDYNEAVVTNPDIVRIVANNIVTAVSGLVRDDNSIVLFPNPVSGNQFHLIHKNAQTRFTRWRLFSSSGNEVTGGSLRNFSQQTTLFLPMVLTNGFYLLELSDGEKVMYKKIMLLR